MPKWKIRRNSFFLRDTEGVEVAVIMKEIKEDEIKVSMRSKEYADVSKICLCLTEAAIREQRMYNI